MRKNRFRDFTLRPKAIGLTERNHENIIKLNPADKLKKDDIFAGLDQIAITNLEIPITQRDFKNTTELQTPDPFGSQTFDKTMSSKGRKNWGAGFYNLYKESKEHQVLHEQFE